jgi:hypothetical protein
MGENKGRRVEETTKQAASQFQLLTKNYGEQIEDLDSFAFMGLV